MSKIYHVERFFPNTVFNEIEFQILQCIIEALRQKTSTNIKVIAESCFTSPSTVSRLVKKTKYKNYSELLFFLNEKLHANTTYSIKEMPFVTVSKPIEEVIEELKSCLSTHQIYIYGEGFCKCICQYLSKKLLVLRYVPIDLDSVEMKLVHSSEKPPLLFIFSRSGETRTCLHKISECYELNGKIISFTSSESSTIANKASISFCIEDHLQGDQANVLPNYFYGNVINLLEVLCYELTK